MASSDDSEYELNREQKLAVDVLWLIGICLSVIGSSLLINVFARSKVTKRNSKDRLLVGLSFFDIVASIRHGLSVIWDNDHVGAVCTFEGYMLAISSTVPLYNAVLGLYFFMTIRKGISQRNFERKYEPWFHGFAILFPFVVATIGLFFKVYNPNETGRFCFITTYEEEECDDEEIRTEEECPTTTRGEYASYFFYLIIGTIPITFLVLIGTNLLIYLHVRKTIHRSTRFSLSNSHDRRTRMVATQSFLYVAAFFLTWIWTMILLFTKDYYGLIVVEHIFLPMQGCLNFLVYIRPTYMRKREGGMSRWEAFRMAAFPHSRPQLLLHRPFFSAPPTPPDHPAGGAPNEDPNNDDNSSSKDEEEGSSSSSTGSAEAEVENPQTKKKNQSNKNGDAGTATNSPAPPLVKAAPPDDEDDQQCDAESSTSAPLKNDDEKTAKTRGSSTALTTGTLHSSGAADTAAPGQGTEPNGSGA